MIRKWFPYVAFFFEAAFAIAILYRYALESEEFRTAVALVFAAAGLGWLLPRAWRLHLLTCVNVIGLFLIFDFRAVIPAIILVILLIAVLRSHLSFVWKIAALVLISGSVLASRRFIHTGLPLETFIQIFGAATMFRGIVYLFDQIQPEPTTRGWPEALSYFFILPSFVMPFFPVIDFKKFVRGRFSKEQLFLNQRAFGWIFNGVVQLIGFRIVKKDGLFYAFEEIINFGDMFRFMFMNYLRYMHISGIFHIAIGLLLLFGFDLPRTNNRYLYAHSFTDYFKRMNSYWKDFLSKTVFIPFYFAFRRAGERLAILASAVLVIIITWALHSYLYLWERDEFPVQLRDIVFWSALGACLLANFYFESRAKSRMQRGFFEMWMRISSLFLFVSFLWMAWTVNDLENFCGRLSRLHWSGPSDFIWLTPFIAVGLLGAWMTRNPYSPPDAAPIKGHWRLVVAGILLLISFSSVRNAVREENSDFALFIDAIAAPLHPIAWVADQGYYEGRVSSVPFEFFSPIPVSPRPWDRGVEQRTSDYRAFEYRPGSSAILGGKLFSVNRLGLQGREFPNEKPAEVTRVAVIGSSFSSSYGVDGGTEWYSLAQDHLSSVQLWNFGVYGYSFLLYPYVMEKKVMRVHPDVLLVEGLSEVFLRTGISISNALHRHLDFPYPELFPLIGISSSKSVFAGFYPAEAPFSTEVRVVDWSLQKLDAMAERAGMKRAILMLPFPLVNATVPPEPRDQLIHRLIGLAQKHHFDVIDMSQMFQGRDPQSLVLPGDLHYNDLAHRLVANEFQKRLKNYLNSDATSQ